MQLGGPLTATQGPPLDLTQDTQRKIRNQNKYTWICSSSGGKKKSTWFCKMKKKTTVLLKMQKLFQVLNRSIGAGLTIIQTHLKIKDQLWSWCSNTSNAKIKCEYEKNLSRIQWFVVTYYLKCIIKAFNDLGTTHFFQDIFVNKAIPTDITKNTIIRGKATAGLLWKPSMRSRGTPKPKYRLAFLLLSLVVSKIQQSRRCN